MSSFVKQVPLSSASHFVVVDPERALVADFTETLYHWGDRAPDGNNDFQTITGNSIVRAAFDAVTRALSGLGDRDDDRAAAIRPELTAQHKTLADALAAIESTCAGAGPATRKFRADGPRINELRAKWIEALRAEQAAQHALANATHQSLAAARDAVQHAAIDTRDVEREIAALREACRFPYFAFGRDVRLETGTKAILTAEAQTAEVVRLAGIQSKKASALAAALDQARPATPTPTIARLWVCFEPVKKPLPELEMRWRMYQEGRDQ